jgi:hypothetical protein
MIFLTYSLIFSLLTSTGTTTESADFHKYYFTKMSMERNFEENSLEVQFRFFSDDLEKVLGEADSFHLRLGDDREVDNADELIFDYLFEHVSISGEGWNEVQVNYIGKDVDNEITLVYIEYTGISKWSEVTISNTIMLDLFEGQSNDISLIRGKELETKGTHSGKFTCNFNLSND